MTRCPICRAQWQGEEKCRRCGAELHLVAQTVAVAREMEQLAVAHLRDGQVDQAVVASRRAMSLRMTPLAQALAGFAAFSCRKPDVVATFDIPAQGGLVYIRVIP